MKKIKRALISVFNKKNLKKLLKILKKNKVEIISSGGTFREIKRLKFKCIEISEYTGSPEILGGRVKTLHPKIHAGILNKRNNKAHYQDLIKNNFKNIDLVIVNFYPFEETLKNNSNHEKIIENIDVGGPTMVRAAAKNYSDVSVITSIDQYDDLIDEMVKYKGKTSQNFRERMSQIAFTETAYYDSLISNYFNKITKNNFPQKKIIYGNLVEKLRYGENPHQESAIYSQNNALKIKQVHGKQLSYNNYNDIFAALTISKSLPKNSGVAIIKHANPCGVSALKDPVECYKSALACDPVSAFGGIVSCNFKVNKKLALELQYLIDNNIKEKGEFQLTNALENMKAKGVKFKPGEVTEWLDCGNKEVTVNTNNKVLTLNKRYSSVPKSDKFVNSVIIPPCFIGDNVSLTNSVIGPHVSIGDNSEIVNCVIENTIIQEESTVCNAIIKNSMIGNKVSYNGKAKDLSIGDFTVIES